MKIVIAPDSFKESLDALSVARAIQRGFAKIYPEAEYCCLGMADGGEGTMQVLVHALNGTWQQVTVEDPCGRPISAHYGLLPDHTAVMEMAQAAGLHLIHGAHRNPLITSTYGVGQMIQDAVNKGVRRIVLGIGGSATNDAGAGMLQALGWRLQDAEQRDLARGGAALSQVHQILPERRELEHYAPLQTLQDLELTVLCDVVNPLCGPQGASAIFGPQKGATAEMVQRLDSALGHFADCASAHGYEDVRHHAGAGAAGGLGFALQAFLGAKLEAGAQHIMHLINIEAQLQTADLLITGEGRMDKQSGMGKVPFELMRLAQRYQVPTIAITGSVGQDVGDLLAAGFSAVIPSIDQLCESEQLFANTASNLERSAEHIAALIKLQLNT
ncbi:glycerate kinase [Brackiella oedipodis]|uniref:glycerate kinase n=1 Tax=Brackiella oedipodis TaxID=124225 RepID=UPI000491B5AA|nr:glycerate kinase [Brackiella oedipodis]